MAWVTGRVRIQPGCKVRRPKRHRHPASNLEGCPGPARPPADAPRWRQLLLAGTWQAAHQAQRYAAAESLLMLSKSILSQAQARMRPVAWPSEAGHAGARGEGLQPGEDLARLPAQAPDGTVRSACPAGARPPPLHTPCTTSPRTPSAPETAPPTRQGCCPGTTPGMRQTRARGSVRHGPSRDGWSCSPPPPRQRIRQWR